MSKQVDKFIENLKLNPPATEGSLKIFEQRIGINLPVEYKEFMLRSNGAEGFIGENSFLAIWPVEEIVSLNKDAKVEEYTPGLVFFASDGGGMAYAFDKRHDNVPIVEIPGDSIHIEDAKLIGKTFNCFLQNLHDAEEYTICSDPQK